MPVFSSSYTTRDREQQHKVIERHQLVIVQLPDSGDVALVQQPESAWDLCGLRSIAHFLLTNSR